jgi:hypothetical protein
LSSGLGGTKVRFIPFNIEKKMQSRPKDFALIAEVIGGLASPK